MRVVVDGIIFQTQKYGGISRIFHEIMPRICALDQNAQFVLYTDGILLQDPPSHPRIIQKKNFPLYSFLRPQRLWAPLTPVLRQIFQKMVLGDGQGVLWHSTFFTRPKGWKGKRVVTVYDLIHEKFSHLFNGRDDDLFRKEKKECIEQADAVITISETTRQDVHKLYGTPLSSIFPAHLACSEAFKVLGENEKKPLPLITKPFLMYVGGRVHYKNFDVLVQAFDRWPQAKHAQLVLVGDALNEAEERKLRELNILEHVCVMSKASDDTLCQLYNQAAAFVYPSLYEGFGIPLLEAMSCGCPVVASRIPTTQEIAADIPLYFEPTSVEGLVHALTQVFQGKDMERVASGLSRAKTFSWDQTAEETLKVYRKVLQ